MRHRTPHPRPLLLFCVNTAGARVLLPLALAASTGADAQPIGPVSQASPDPGEVPMTAGWLPLTIARGLANQTPGGVSIIACGSATPAAKPRAIVSS